MILRDKKLNKELLTKGYVVVPFLSDGQVQELKKLYAKYGSNSPHFHSTTFSSDLETKKTVSAEVGAIFEDQLKSFFEGYRTLGASFLCKPPGQGGVMPVHQDWTVVDEADFGSFTIWVPLQDVDENNGAIRVLDGSHELCKTLRGPSLPAVIRDIDQLIEANMKTLCMKAGEAFIFNHALIHASNMNKTEHERVAITFGLVPQKAELMFYHRNESGVVEKYLVEDDFFMRYVNIGQQPTFVTPVEEADEKFEQVTEKQFHEFYEKYKAKIMKPIFKDPLLQQKYNDEGYVLIDLLSAEEVNELKEYYNTLNNDHIPSYGFHVSLDNSSPDFVTGVMGKIKSVITKHAAEIFDDFKIFTSAYVVKEKNPIGVVPPHQDWTFTDEAAGYTSSTVWTALVDTDLYNGAMGVVVGSHKYFDHHRASPAPQFKTPLDTHVFSIFPYLKLVPMKAGQALIFDNRTVHASPPNVSDGVRLAVGFGVTQADAPLYHFHMQHESEGKKLEQYEVDDYFYTHFNNGKLSALYDAKKKPEGLKFMGLVDNGVQPISSDELMAKIKASGNTFNIEMVEHLAKLFNYNIDGSKREESASTPVAEPQKEVLVEEKQPEPEVKQPQPQQAVEQKKVWVDKRGFFEKYTPLNIIREIKQRVL